MWREEVVAGIGGDRRSPGSAEEGGSGGDRRG